MKAQALQATFKNKSGRLVLEGTSNAPVMFDHTVDGHESRTSARRVTVSLKTGQTQADGVKLYRSIPKQQTDGTQTIPIPHTN